MPRASKWSGAKLLQRNYEGLSGADQLYRWETQRCAPGGIPMPASGPRPCSSWLPNIDTSKPWYERRDDDYYCLLCSAFATDGHVVSDKHKKREANPEWYGFSADRPQVMDEEVYNKPWFEQRGPGDWYCLLCHACATEGHLESQRHENRSKCPEAYGYPDPNIHHFVDPQPFVPEPEQRNNDVWQTLTCPESGNLYYHNPITGVTQWERPNEDIDDLVLTDGSFEQGSRYNSAPPQEQPSREHASEEDKRSRRRQDLKELPPGWVRVFSQEYEDFYYHNAETGVVQWERPTTSEDSDDFDV